MKIAITDLKTKMLKTLSQTFSAEDSARIVEVLLWAELADIKPMGVAKMVGTEPIQSVKPKYAVKIDRDTKLSQLIDAGANPAPLVCQLATDVAIQKAKEHGMAIVGVHNTFSSNLTQAFYVEKMAKAGLIGISMAGSPAVMAVEGGIDPVFGTNPVGFGFPTDDDPLIFDMTISAMTWSGLVMAKVRGDKLPENVAIDKEGNPTLDPAAAMDGAMLPFDGSYKGSGLGLIVEFLTGPLLSAAYADVATDTEWGSLLIAIDPNLLVDTDDFKKHSSDLLRKVKASRRKPGVDEIRLPGERAAATRKAAELSGEVDVDDKVLEELGYI